MYKILSNPLPVVLLNPQKSVFNTHAVGSSPVAQMIKNLLTMQETWIPSLGWEDPLEEGMAAHSSILAWRIRMDRGAGWATVHGVTESTQLSD